MDANGEPKYHKKSLVDAIGDATVGPNQYLVVDFDALGWDLAKNVSSRSIVIADDENEYDSTIYSTEKSGTSLAYFADGWKATYAPTEGTENVYQQWQSCAVGKIINTATGNCVNADSDVAAACPSGSYRNPETGRCKKIASEAATATACASGYFRNPATNRCKKYGTETTVSACQSGWERNPTTNRCRKIVSSTPANFAVENAGASSKNNAMVWLAGGGIVATGGAIGASYREDLWRWILKLRRKI
jgi:hypothetical protein